MPDLDQDSIPPTAPAVPPAIDPATWEDFPAFRATFLMFITPPGYAAAIRTAGEMLYSLLLETPAEWPGWPESSTRMELRAAVADLRHLHGFLRSVGKERKLSSLSTEDAWLSHVAGKMARQVGRIASSLEKELAGEVKP